MRIPECPNSQSTDGSGVEHVVGTSKTKRFPLNDALTVRCRRTIVFGSTPGEDRIDGPYKAVCPVPTPVLTGSGSTGLLEASQAVPPRRCSEFSTAQRYHVGFDSPALKRGWREQHCQLNAPKKRVVDQVLEKYQSKGLGGTAGNQTSRKIGIKIDIKRAPPCGTIGASVSRIG